MIISTIGRFTAAGKVGIVGLLLIVFIAVFAPFVTLYEPSALSGRSLEPPGAAHILGTDELGMDIWSQICYGARMSLVIGLAVALILLLLCLAFIGRDMERIVDPRLRLKGYS